MGQCPQLYSKMVSLHETPSQAPLTARGLYQARRIESQRLDTHWIIASVKRAMHIKTSHDFGRS